MKDDTPARGINIIIVYTGRGLERCSHGVFDLIYGWGDIYNGAIGVLISRIATKVVHR